ncbi:hypothetical protein IGS73_17715 [Janibacter indicus]|uniref:MNN4 protein n=1 Tax=Janibacter indicus TaxID=857417 RepID=A0A1L3MKI4_9MICO|nr:hypothetical protein [Janibacter indicus]APH02867.1 hypothetical protein ASJ30_16100 [Janibacter indicus]QOK22837.1 hypothetical protein IGS73_17715 [Janibacter indicus]
MTAPIEPRLRRRRRMILATILPAIVLVVLAIRFLTLPVFIGQAQDAHGGDDGPGMVKAADRLHPLNIVERWRAPFVEGTGKSIDGDLEGGRADLETALDRTKNPQDDCTVRTNLVITISQQADAAKEAGDEDKEKSLAEEALKLIEEGPEGCLDGSDDGNGGEAGRKQQEQKDKLEEQTGKSQPEEPQEPEDQGDDGEGEDEEKKDPKQKELEERNQQGQRQSETDRREEEGEEKGSSGAGVDKPW